MRAIARAASRACAVCSGHVPRSSSRIRALPPNAMTRRATWSLLRAADRQPDRPSRAVGRVAPGVRMRGSEVDGIALLQVVVLAVDPEAHLALEQHHELLAGVDHRLGAAVRAGLDERLRARGEERAVAPGHVLQLEAALGGVELRALVAAHDGHRPQRVGLLDEVPHAAPERGGHLHEARDGRRHAALLDLVNRGGREPGTVRELLQRPAALGPRLGHLGAEGRDRLLDLGGEMGLRAHQLSKTKSALSERPTQWPIVSYRRWTSGRKTIDERSHGAHLPVGSLDSGRAIPIEQRSRSDTIGRRETVAGTAFPIGGATVAKTD